MPKNKPLDFTGATLKSNGGTVDRDRKLFTNLYWQVTLADGTVIRRNNLHSNKRAPEFIWERQWPRGKDWHGVPEYSFRELGAFDNTAVDEWVRAHPDFCLTKPYEGSL